MITMREAALDLGLPWMGATAAIQGFGNVGSHLAASLVTEGVKVIAVRGVPLRTAAYAIALQRVADAEELRGN